MRPVIVTGAAGFIGMHVCERLLARGEQVVGIDALTPYYDPALKEARLARFAAHPNYMHLRGDLADAEAVNRVFHDFQPQRVVKSAVA